ncbi:nuclear transport factor 2 family protein [Streptomyces sp. NPDC051644]|uniref:nuclear transport factor 2 family protein n=1 Tax=Streptomyces sp. NPDC051644 TaxID=3365666 RepID=UPI003795C97B
MDLALPTPYADFELPLTELTVGALRFAEETEPGVIYRHSLRSYLFAAELADGRGLKPGIDYDDELVFLSCVLHDLGLSEKGNGDQRFEVDGADLAARFLRDHGAGEDTVAVVWDAVALHTSDGIAARKGPEVALAQAGIGLDILGRGKEELRPGFAERIHTAFPREDLGYALTDIVAEQALANPAKAGPIGGFPGQVLRSHLPYGELPDWHDLIDRSGWGDRPAGVRSDAAIAREPGELSGLFERCLEAGDLEGLVSLYEPQGVFVPDPSGTVATGIAAIKEALRPYVDNGARVTLQLRKIHRVGDIAVLSSSATVTGLAPEPVTTDTTEVVRRQLDGRWLYAVDDPFFGA